MYDLNLTHQALPTKRYIYLLGIAVYVFSSNNCFIIENIVRTDANYSIDDLLDKTSGKLKDDIKRTITQNSNKDIETKFSDLVDRRNRMIHSYGITIENGNQILATKESKGKKRYRITEDFLEQFIRDNDELSNMLHQYRGY